MSGRSPHTCSLPTESSLKGPPATGAAGESPQQRGSPPDVSPQWKLANPSNTRINPDVARVLSQQPPPPLSIQQPFSRRSKSVTAEAGGRAIEPHSEPRQINAPVVEMPQALSPLIENLTKRAEVVGRG